MSNHKKDKKYKCPSCLEMTCVQHPVRKCDRLCLAKDCGFESDVGQVTVKRKRR